MTTPPVPGSLVAYLRTVHQGTGPLQVWDGAARESYGWDGLQKVQWLQPELEEQAQEEANINKNSA